LKNALRFGKWILGGAVMLSGAIFGQTSHATNPAAELHLHIISSLVGKHRSTPAVIWLEPIGDTDSPPFLPHGHYTLVQENRTFIPHLQVVPVGSVVSFPNKDPFFHNVFSLFKGQRFNLGLYEAGSTKSVTFSRLGVSYIFCNIHPEMSAVVIALNTPLYAVADKNDEFLLPDVPPGSYKLYVWIEGVSQSFLDSMSRTVHLRNGMVDLGTLKAPMAGIRTIPHANLYGRSYTQDAAPTQSPY
jgi:hypothetical protein